MGIISTLFLGLTMGIVFGFVLEKSRVFEPGMIIGQFQLRKFIMLKVFLTAIITGLVIFSCFFALGFDRLSWKTTIYSADIVGGLLLGIGVAMAGACPGTLFAQIGAGYKDSIATLIGGLTGAMVYLKLEPLISGFLLNAAPKQKLTLDTLLGVNFGTAAFILIACFAIILYFLERYKPTKKELENDLDGSN